MENSEKSAFPLDGNHTGHPDTIGLTKIEHFTALAMQSFIQKELADPFNGHINYVLMAEKSVLAAYEVLKSLQQKPEILPEIVQEEIKDALKNSDHADF